jgi:hypothetical protein
MERKRQHYNCTAKAVLFSAWPSKQDQTPHQSITQLTVKVNQTDKTKHVYAKTIQQANQI